MHFRKPVTTKRIETQPLLCSMLEEDVNIIVDEQQINCLRPHLRLSSREKRFRLVNCSDGISNKPNFNRFSLASSPLNAFLVHHPID